MPSVAALLPAHSKRETRADLIVLDKNPLEGLRNLNSIRFVMKAGVMYRTADLAKALGYASRE